MNRAVALRPPSELAAFAPYGALLVLALAAGLLIHPLGAIAIVALGLVVLARPLDPPSALAAVAAVASFANNEGGHMTRDLAIVCLFAVYAVASVWASGALGRWRLPDARPLIPLALFFAWTFICAARGVAAGYSLRFLGLELAGLLSLGFLVLGGGLSLDAQRLRPALWILGFTGLVHVLLGIYSYQINHIRTGGVWYTPLSGMLALLMWSLALRAPTRIARLQLALLTGLLLFHQLISFSRGYWLGLLVALPWVSVTWAGRGEGSGERWRSLLRSMLLALACMAVATVFVGLWFGWSDLLGLIGTRFASSFSTKQASESASNVARLIEYVASGRLIAQSPWIGHGLGLELRIRQPIFNVITRQWYVHHAYLWLWIKEGLVGLVLFVTVLVSAFRCCARGMRTLSGESSAWCAGAAGATLYLAVVNLTTFHFAQVNSNVALGVMWGVALALQRPDDLRIVWRDRKRP